MRFGGREMRSGVPLLLVFLLMLSATSACGAGERPGTGDTRAVAPTKRSGPQELVVGAPADSFVTEGDKANLGMFPINANIFETLVRMTPDFQLEPWLAVRWESRDGNTWRFHLRDQVAFHDGQRFTAEAVKYSFDRLARGSGARLGIGANSTRVIDDRTVDVVTTKPNPGLPSQLVHPSLGPMIAPGSDVGKKPVGTGPFRFVEYAPSQRLVVESNDDYWGDPAELDRIRFRFIPDGNTRWLSLETGEVDLIYDLPRELVAEARQTAGVELQITPPGSSEIMFLNRSGKSPYSILGDRMVRLAVGHAVDRKAIVEQIWGDAAEVADTVTPAALFGAHASIVRGPTHDPAKAETLLEDAGWRPGRGAIRVKDGRRLSLTMVNGYPPIDLRKPMPELVQAHLKEVGIEIKIIETPELGTYLDRLEKGEGDIFLERVAQNDATPSFFAANFFYSKAEPPYPTWFAAGPHFDRLLEESVAAEDRELAKKKAAEAMQVAVDEEAVVVPVAATAWLFAMKDDVEGFVSHGSARHVRWAPVYRAD